MFTNAINPVQANAALSSLRTIRSEEGKRLREKVLSNAGYLRDLLQAKNYEVLGRLSPFVCVKVGNEIVSRLIIRILMDNGIFQTIQKYMLIKSNILKRLWVKQLSDSVSCQTILENN